MAKICAIICYWDGENILPHAVKQWNKLNVDVIIVYSNASNYRTVRNNSQLLTRPEYHDCILFKCEPLDSLQPVDNERRKRNFGLQKARELGYTHFITADADEIYTKEAFDSADLDANGNVGICRVYFKSATLTIGVEQTRIPFIHKLTPTIAHSWNRNYPFAFDEVGIRIDPTRQMNINTGVVLNEKIICEHFSWVRKDFDSKIENSTARNNIRRSTILRDLENAAPGYYCNFYKKTLVKCDDQFGIHQQ